MQAAFPTCPLARAKAAPEHTALLTAAFPARLRAEAAHIAEEIPPLGHARPRIVRHRAGRVIDAALSRSALG